MLRAVASVAAGLNRYPDREFGELRAALAGYLARETGGAAQAVGRAVGANPVSILVPCHRVVAANGAQVVVGGRLIDREVFSHAAVRRLAHAVDLFDTLHLALFDRTKSYLLDDEGKFVREVDKDLPNVERIWELPSAEVNIIKASVFCDDGAVMDYAYVLSRELGDEFVFAPSGNAWIDAMQAGVSKATGIAQLMDHYGIAPEEVMAFGDSMNDYEIIRLVGCGCAMANGRPALRAVADRVVGCNRDHAVQAELRRVLEELD